MMQKTITHIHFWCTVSGVLLVTSSTTAAMALFTVGARSLPLCLLHGINYAFDGMEPLATFCINWIWIFPIVYLVLYLLSVIKKRYALFGIAIALDTAFRCILAVLIHYFEDISGLSDMIFDAIVGLAICALFFYAGHIDKKRKKTSTADTAQ